MAKALVPAVAMLALAAPAAAAPSFTIRADTHIGSFRVKPGGNLAGAIRAFGQPSSLRGGKGACRAAWARYGFVLDLYNLGGRNPCKPEYGFFSKATMHGKRWRTSKGLAIGDRLAKLRKLYPRARFHRGIRGAWPAGWWLAPRIYYPVAAKAIPGLLAEVRAGRVSSFQVHYQAGGE